MQQQGASKAAREQLMWVLQLPAFNVNTYQAAICQGVKPHKLVLTGLGVNCSLCDIATVGSSCTHTGLSHTQKLRLIHTNPDQHTS